MRGATGALLVLALAGCAKGEELPTCVGTAGEGAVRVAERVPVTLHDDDVGAVLSESVDMSAEPPVADVGFWGPTTDGIEHADVPLGSTLEIEGTTYEVVMVCVSRVYLTQQD